MNEQAGALDVELEEFALTGDFVSDLDEPGQVSVHKRAAVEGGASGAAARAGGGWGRGRVKCSNSTPMGRHSRRRAPSSAA